MQLEGLFEIAPSKKSAVDFKVELPFEDRDWQIGLIVGPSGSGKSTVARELFGQKLVSGFDWDKNKSVVDGFPSAISIKEITALLGSVGFSSPPSWLRPFGVLSNGEQFRVTLARALAEPASMIVFDEFTSVIDRQVARIGSAAVAKAVRKLKKQFVAVSCHYDVEPWLEPDWVYQPQTNTFFWRSVQLRPRIKLEIQRVDRAAWSIFKRHHYLDSKLAPTAKCFLASIDGEPAAFASVISFPHPRRAGWREHRTVCLPDFQGVGIGNAVSEFVATLFAASKPYFSSTSNPAMIYHRARSPLWHMNRKPSRSGANKGIKSLNKTAALTRYTAGFEYVGPKADETTRTAFGLR